MFKLESMQVVPVVAYGLKTRHSFIDICQLPVWEFPSAFPPVVVGQLVGSRTNGVQDRVWIGDISSREEVRPDDDQSVFAVFSLSCSETGLRT